RVLEDSVEPWDMEGEVLMDSGQIEFFGRDGFPSYSLSYNAWGMNFNPLDDKYFITCISVLKDPFSGNLRVDSERDLIQFDPNLPNGNPVMPSGITVSNTGGVYSLIDSELSSTNGFVTRGVQVGDQLTLYALWYLSGIISGTYEVTTVVSENELWLDRDPLQPGQPTQVDTLSYIMMMQPWVTLETFRANIPYYDENPSKGPKAHNKGGLSPDGGTLYLGDIISENLIAVDTQQRETFSIFVSAETLHDYVLAQNLAGRRHPIINADRAFADGTVSGWSIQTTFATYDDDVSSPAAVGSESLGVMFNAAGAQLKLHASYDPEDDVPRSAADYTHLRFWLHGGFDGGQQIDVSLYDHNGAVGSSVAVPTPLSEAWTLVQIPISDFGVATIGDIVFDDGLGAAQPIFYLDDVGLEWIEPLPEWVGMFDTNGAGLAASQVHCDSNGVVWFSEGQTDDILWTTNGTDLNTFLTSNETVAGYVAAGVIDPTDYTKPTNGVQHMGLITDPMGTVYWADNQARSIWKAPAKNPAGNIIELATRQEIKDALALGTRSPRGLNCFSIRGMELLTFNFVDSNTVFKVDLDTFDYGDFDADFDVDMDDFDPFFTDCLAGPGITIPPPACSSNAFAMTDMDDDGDVDCDDWLLFRDAWTGPPAEPPVLSECDSGAGLIDSFPAHDDSLWRLSNNFIRLTFDAAISDPSGAIQIRTLESGRSYGATDYSSGFTFSVVDDGLGTLRVLEVRENGTVLPDETWIAIFAEEGAWPGVESFAMHLMVQVGDASNDGNVTFSADAGLIYGHVGATGVADDSRVDMNGDHNITFSADAGTVYGKVGATAVDKPLGHVSRGACSAEGPEVSDLNRESDVDRPTSRSSRCSSGARDNDGNEQR
ncbi:MAG: hypothetical protein GY842_04965, partial [bacterium]|nr:hypothetical protein [bacterium]